MQNQQNQTAGQNNGISSVNANAGAMAGASASDLAEAAVNDAVTATAQAAQGDFVRKIATRIKGAENILVAMSKTPSVDELAAAIALTTFLESIQRHTTAVCSSPMPDALAFLQPTAAFETNTSSLQDFIIALDKEKADHLRYKLEGDFVKVFITPYRATITQDDLTFSRGEYNVDFVIAMNVKSAGDLDEALSEHARIMHNASAVNITRGDPGRFGEIEWSNPAASSVCEMTAQLIFELQGSEANLERDVATALLTGIVAATERFSNKRTSADTLGLASKLMVMGADQQMISANVMQDNVAKVNEEPEQPEVDPVQEARLAAQAEAEQAIRNPAAQVAQGLAGPAGPDPAAFAIPGMPTMDVSGTVVAPTGAIQSQAPAAATLPPAPQTPGVSNVPVMDGVASAMSAVPGQPVPKPEAILPPPPAPMVNNVPQGGAVGQPTMGQGMPQPAATSGEVGQQMAGQPVAAQPQGVTSDTFQMPPQLPPVQVPPAVQIPNL